MSDPTLFTTRMRKATREVHSISDALVNAKLALALNSDEVWAEGLYRFYLIFKILENAMIEKKDENLGKLLLNGMARTKAFEDDLTYYYGVDWKSPYVMRPGTEFYYSHLQTLYKNDPDLLMAYVYHLYMGLLSGGQILQKKRAMKKKLFGIPEKLKGVGVTDFGDKKISDLKNELRNTMNSIAEGLDDDTQMRIIEEGKRVFELNNRLIESIDNVNSVFRYRVLLVFFSSLALFLAYYFFIK